MANRQPDKSGQDPGTGSEVGQELADLLADWRKDCGTDASKAG